MNAAVQIYETSYANISGIGDGLSIILHLDSLNVGYGSSQRGVKNTKNTESAESKASSGSIADEGESSAETVAAHSIISNFDRMASDGSSVYISCVPCNPNTNFSADENSEAESENKTVFSNFKNPTVVALRNNGLVKIENNFKKVKVSNGNGASQHAALKMTSAGIEMAGTFDLQKLKLFVDELIYHNGVESNALDNNAANTLGNENGEHVSNANKKMEIIRMKGVFKCTNDVIAHDVDHLYILQSICDIFEIQRSSIVCGSADDKTNNVNKFIIIGQNVDVDTVTKSLAACLV